MPKLVSSTLRRLGGFASSRSGNMAIWAAIAAMPLLGAVGLAVDYTDALRKKSDLQVLVDGAVLAGGASKQDPAETAHDFFIRTAGLGDAQAADLAAKGRISFAVKDDHLVGDVRWTYPRIFGLGQPDYDVRVAAEVQLPKATQGACIIVLANSPQALLLNSGAKMNAPACEIHVHSTQDPAFILNAGVNLDITRLCVKGHKYIRNGGAVTKLETGCTVEDDPYAGAIPEPTVPTNCQTSGAKDGGSHTLSPGAHCWVNFNGSPTITFKPGLHIIRGPMIINSGSTVIAEGVTFYFPDRDSKIQANGALTMRATAPASGTYKGTLMFEKTSDAASNPWTQQYVFNGSNGEYLEGVIHLPYRDVTYNSTTNINASKLTLIVNTLIVNSANWAFEGASGGGGPTAFYLMR